MLVSVNQSFNNDAGKMLRCALHDGYLDLTTYDGKKMFLPQSNQLYIEMLTQAVEGGRVCCEIQSFRKELNARFVRMKAFFGHLQSAT